LQRPGKRIKLDLDADLAIVKGKIRQPENPAERPAIHPAVRFVRGRHAVPDGAAQWLPTT
jgi:hypothetical protein